MATSASLDACLIEAARALSEGAINGGTLRTLVYLLEHGTSITRNHREMAAERGISSTSFSYHVTALANAGLIHLQRRGRALSTITIQAAER